MEIYYIYQSIVLIYANVNGIEQIGGKTLFSALGMSAGVWLILFLLQGFGLYTMAKNRNLKKKWLAFIPFASVWYMGKLAGSCDVFGRKMHRPGLYTLIAQVLTAALCAAVVSVEFLLFTKYRGNMEKTQYGYVWTELTGSAYYAYNFYNISDYIVSIVQLIYAVLLFILLMGLYKKYYTRGYMLLSWVALFVPLSRYIVIFVLRKNKAIDYDAYMRAKRDEFLRRRQQQQNGYGPYGGNPYGGPMYGQGPYDRNPYGNPYGENRSSDGGYGRTDTTGGAAPRPDDPFSEFAPGASDRNAASDGKDKGGTGGNGAADKPNGNSEVDDLFN